MQTYQILTIIGGILGLLISFSVLFIAGFLQFGFHLKVESDDYYFYGAVSASIILYIVSITVAFASKNTKFIGVTLIVCSFLILISASIYGIIGFALLLPAGITALRKKKVEEDLSKI